MSALVEEAVRSATWSGFHFSQGDANLVELTLPDGLPRRRHRVGDVAWPQDTALVDDHPRARVLTPEGDPLEAGDELLFVAPPDRGPQLEDLLSPHVR